MYSNGGESGAPANTLPPPAPAEPAAPLPANIDPDVALKRCFSKPDNLLQEMIANFLKDAETCCRTYRFRWIRRGSRQAGIPHGEGNAALPGAEAAAEAALKVSVSMTGRSAAKAAEALSSLERECEIFETMLSARQFGNALSRFHKSQPESDR